MKTKIINYPDLKKALDRRKSESDCIEIQDDKRSDNMNYTEPKTLPGFMELYPNEQVEFERIKNIITAMERC